MAWYDPRDWAGAVSSAISNSGVDVSGLNPLGWGQKDVRFKDAEELRGLARQGIQDVANRQAPTVAGTRIAPVQTGQAAQIATGPQDQFRQMQLQTAQRLAGIASGQQKGAGQMAVEDQVRRGVSAQQAMARMARGTGAGTAARAAARGSADLAVAGAGQARQAATAEQQAAAGQLAGVAGAGRQQDIGVAEAQAQMQQQMNLANLSAENQRIFQQAGLDQARNLAEVDARLRQMGMNDQMRLAYMGQLFNVNQAEMAAVMAQNQQAAQQIGGLISAAGQAGGFAALVSDRRAKTKIRKGKDDIDEMLDRTTAYSWIYKNSDHGKGTHAGVMAQDLERSAMGREMVRDRADGLKEIDGQKALSAALAAAARLNERLRAVERKVG